MSEKKPGPKLRGVRSGRKPREAVHNESHGRKMASAVSSMVNWKNHFSRAKHTTLTVGGKLKFFGFYQRRLNNIVHICM